MPWEYGSNQNPTEDQGLFITCSSTFTKGSHSGKKMPHVCPGTQTFHSSEIPKSLQKQRMVNNSHINAHSFTNKASQFQLEICDRNTDICAITETCIKQDDIDAMTKKVQLQGYKILSRPRSGGKTRGGLALVYSDHHSVKHWIILMWLPWNTRDITLRLSTSPPTFNSAMSPQAS